jgi:hypothetical protein
MEDHLMDTPLTNKELDNYRQGELYTDAYSLELLHRATILRDQESRTWVQHCFGEMVRGWLHRHPKREMACRLESEEYYVAQTFKRFWLESVHAQEGAINSLAVALRYLRASLNSALLEKLRAFSEPGESSSILDPYEAEESLVEKRVTGSEVWAIIQGILLDAREQRLAYLLFYCGLSPKEVLCCSSEFDDLSEISLLRYTIMEHLFRHADQLPSSIFLSKGDQRWEQKQS